MKTNITRHLWSRRGFLRDAALVSSVFALPSLGIAQELVAGVKGGTLRYGTGDSKSGEKLDPASASNASAAIISQVVFETLISRDRDFNLYPSLAESWSLSEDGLTWIFNLRQGVKFHDGSVFTAEDAKWSIQRILDEATGSPMKGRFSASFEASDVKVLDPYTLSIKTKRIDTLLPVTLTRSYCAILKNGTSPLIKTASAIGTGAFKITSFAPGQAWEVNRWEGYWRSDTPYLNKIQCVAIPDQNTRIQAVKSGSVDVVDVIDPITVKKLENDSNLRIARSPNSLWYGIFIDQTVKPFDNILVRKAIKLAVNRQLILDVVYGGQGTVTPDVPVPLSDRLYPNIKVSPPDIAKAKALLTEAGYPNGIEFELFTSDVASGFVNLAVVFGESLKEAGITVKITQWPKETYWDQVWGKRPVYLDYMLRRHAYDTLDVAYVKDAPFNGSKYDQDGKLRSLIDNALSERDEHKQSEVYKGALAQVASDSGTIIPAFIDRTLVMHKNVGGNPFETEDPASYYKLFKQT